MQQHPILPAALPAHEALRRTRGEGLEWVIDVRTGAELAAEAVPGARHIPLDELPARIDELRALAGPKLLICRSGARAEQARLLLAEHGITDACVVTGGIQAWAEAGGVVVRNTRRLSLERQVRIAAGFLVVLGVGLGYALHPALHLLALFVGSGLVFAGLTDRCGMALVLARMPWNRSAPAAACAAPGAGAGSPSGRT
jgi:rhodanese-related sulfurtransferase